MRNFMRTQKKTNNMQRKKKTGTKYRTKKGEGRIKMKDNLETKAIVVPGDTHKIKRLKTQPRITS
jgi:hypothetical protein